MMPTPAERLNRLLAKAAKQGQKRCIADPQIQGRVDFVCRCLSNRAGVRLLMSCMLAKLDRPEVDPRKPYTEIGDPDCFSGRSYDEKFLTPFINDNHLPCNSTTAFLTPTLRNQNTPLTTKTVLVGRPPQLYSDTLQLLDDVATGKATAEQMLTDTVCVLLQVRDEKRSRMGTLVAALSHDDGGLPLASEAIVTVLQQHLACKHSSRLPVLIVAAAYEVAADRLAERALPLKGHNAADEQTGAMGDVEVSLTNDEQLVTIYEMKSKRVSRDDIDRALQKIVVRKPQIDNYVFITTDVIEQEVREYAAGMYEQTNGTEIVILDCIGFVRHFLHLFHRLRIAFVDAYQRLLLREPDSAVNQPLKEAFLTLRQAAESDE
jgi:hypothetical protein